MDKKTRSKMRRDKKVDCHKDGTRIDFLQYLDTDVSIHILSCLDDPMDLIRASGVSSSWRHFVMSNEFARKLCLRRFPPLSNIVDIVKKNDERPTTTKVKPNFKGAFLEDHVVYSYFLHTLSKSDVPGWFSTFHVYGGLCLLSKEHNGPPKPESFVSHFSRPIIITGIDIRPLEAFFRSGKYSPKSIRYRVGYDSVWTYTSPEFPLMQVEGKDCLQPFQLPEPICHYGTCVLVDLFGWDQKWQTDRLSKREDDWPREQNPRVMGHRLNLHPAFKLEMVEPNGKLLLKYNLKLLLRLIHSYYFNECSKSGTGTGTVIKWWCRRRIK